MTRRQSEASGSKEVGVRTARPGGRRFEDSRTVRLRATRPYVTEEYARAYEAGALAALEWIADEYPALNESSDDYPSPTEAAAEHIGEVIDLMLGRSK